MVYLTTLIGDIDMYIVPIMNCLYPKFGYFRPVFSLITVISALRLFRRRFQIIFPV